MEKHNIRPYARLLTMLGDQLIKNETIALTELVKNAYDADADVCRVKFINFNCDSTNNSESIIEISDNGYGMSKDIITKHFLNPATPIKKSGKELRKSKKGRICQGEKGIGRFSMLKLGKKVTVYSKEPECAVVHSIKFDFGDYDEEFLFRNGISEEIFLDQIEIQYDECVISSFDSTSLIAESQHGTVIRIEQLKGEWNQNKIDEFKKDMVRFSPFEIDDNSIVNNMDFNTDIYINGEQDNYKKSAIKKIEDIIYNKALYKVSRRYEEKNKRISFSYIEANDVKSTVVVYLSDNAPEDRNSIDFKGIRFYDAEVRKYFDGGSTTSCGDFSYEFYIFDFEAKPNEFFGLSKEDKEVVRDHRIFLYRDNVRVQPYGAPNDDWLQIDRTRAKDKAGNMFSNDQIVGQIKITKANNKNLKDKTSREGIIEDTIAFEQLSKLVKALLSFLRIKIYQRYKAREIAKKEVKSLAAEKQTRSDDIKSLREECKGNEFALRKLDAIEASIDKQERVYTQRIDVVEQLAGVGISVETASHDIMLSIDKLRDVVHQIHINSEDNLVWDREKIYNDSENAENLTSLIYMKMKDLQQIFVSSKQRPRPINVEDVIKKIESIYSKAYRERNIKVEYVKIGNSPVKAKTIDAVLFQVFINLFDNSLYWLQFINRERKVVIYLDGNLQRVIFADNGIGIAVEDAPYIFEAFYSGKGEEGRGLGLYIAKKLLNRYSYDMDVIINDYDKKECGANFSVEFTTDENLGV